MIKRVVARGPVDLAVDLRARSQFTDNGPPCATQDDLGPFAGRDWDSKRKAAIDRHPPQGRLPEYPEKPRPRWE